MCASLCGRSVKKVKIEGSFPPSYTSSLSLARSPCSLGTPLDLALRYLILEKKAKPPAVSEQLLYTISLEVLQIKHGVGRARFALSKPSYCINRVSHTVR
ncbi:Hypothetical predicted protein [Xyrichtys novacula]|uniref:Uncharacterized protein n=1 Tax=Xyrichtys novacula TaxID=13765 RepID=A0AAV1GKD8_XYRNO|nr:Hypothetical predicted protein [Xyrichtys novacula]